MVYCLQITHHMLDFNGFLKNITTSKQTLLIHVPPIDSNYITIFITHKLQIIYDKNSKENDCAPVCNNLNANNLQG